MDWKEYYKKWYELNKDERNRKRRNNYLNDKGNYSYLSVSKEGLIYSSFGNPCGMSCFECTHDDCIIDISNTKRNLKEK